MDTYKDTIKTHIRTHIRTQIRTHTRTIDLVQGGFGICSTLSVDISATEEEEACQLSVSVQRRVMERCGILLLHTFVFSVFLFCFFVFCFHEALCDGMECCGVLNLYVLLFGLGRVDQ